MMEASKPSVWGLLETSRFEKTSHRIQVAPGSLGGDFLLGCFGGVSRLASGPNFLARRRARVAMDDFLSGENKAT
jgi:hypothetical protein